MREVKLTNSKKTFKVDDEDYPLVSEFKWYLRSTGSGYCVNRTSKPSISIGRLLLGIMDAGLEPDHKDRDVFNNQRGNLRVVTSSQNKANQSIRADNTSGYKGVSYRKDRGVYTAYINYGGRRDNLGCFKDAVSAALAYNRAAIQYFGEFANLNKV